MKKNTLLVLCIILTLALGFGFYFKYNLNQEKQGNELPTDPDFRSRPARHFEIPDRLETGYVHTQDYQHAQDWKISIYDKEDENPLNFKIVNGEIECEQTSPEESFPFRVSKKLINDKVYCIQAMSEGAAGSVFTTYDYATIMENKIINIHFVVQYVQCSNYSEPQKTECEQERETLDLDLIVDKIIQSGA